MLVKSVRGNVYIFSFSFFFLSFSLLSFFLFIFLFSLVSFCLFENWLFAQGGGGGGELNKILKCDICKFAHHWEYTH